MFFIPLSSPAQSRFSTLESTFYARFSGRQPQILNRGLAHVSPLSFVTGHVSLSLDTVQIFHIAVHLTSNSF